MNPTLKFVSILWMSACALSSASGHLLRLHATETKNSQSDAEHIYKGKEVDKKPVVTSKPEPERTDAAKLHRIQGTVVLRCVFASTGETRNFFVVSGLPDGLTDTSIAAAKRVKFKPAIKDGKPVSIWMELRYVFHP